MGKAKRINAATFYKYRMIMNVNTHNGLAALMSGGT